MKTPFRSLLRGFAAAALLLPFALAAGCEDHHGDGSGPVAAGGGSEDRGGGSENGFLVGTWKLVGNDGSFWFAHFAADGSWSISDDAAGAARRVYGTYSAKGASFSGPMVNPNAGDGEIKGTVDGGTMSLDFIEHWHTPYKHVPYTGTKL